MITAPQESLNTFTAVRVMSRIRSTAKIRPMPSAGRPMAARMMAMATRLAAGIPATPIEVSSAISTTVNCAVKPSSIP